MNDEQILYIVIGTPGSGKSSYVKNNLAGLPHFEADMYFMRNGNYEFDYNKLNTAHKWCQNQVQNTLKRGQDCVVSNTSLSPRELNDYFKIVRSLNKNIKIDIVECKYINSNDPNEVSIYNSVHFDRGDTENMEQLAKNFVTRNNIDKRVSYYTKNRDIIRSLKLHTLTKTGDNYKTSVEEFKI